MPFRAVLVEYGTENSRVFAPFRPPCLTLRNTVRYGGVSTDGFRYGEHIRQVQYRYHVHCASFVPRLGTAGVGGLI